MQLGLSSLPATQLWHHLYIGGGLCDLPQHAPSPQVDRPTPQVDRPTLPPAAA